MQTNSNISPLFTTPMARGEAAGFVAACIAQWRSAKAIAARYLRRRGGPDVNRRNLIADLAADLARDAEERLCYAILAASGEASVFSDFTDAMWTYRPHVAAYEHDGLIYNVAYTGETPEGDPRPWAGPPFFGSRRGSSRPCSPP